MAFIVQEIIVMHSFLSSALPYTIKDLEKYGKEKRKLANLALNSPLNDPSQRPPGINQLEDPVDVGLSIYIKDLNFCSKYQTFTAVGYFRQFWTDPR